MMQVENVWRLGFSIIAKLSTRMCFWLCGEIEDEEIGFKEITLCRWCLGKEKTDINGSNTF